MSLNVWHKNVDWLKISIVDRNDREELTSVYEVGLYAILCRKLVQCQEILCMRNIAVFRIRLLLSLKIK
jgi:hypothetical protein